MAWSKRKTFREKAQLTVVERNIGNVNYHIHININTNTVINVSIVPFSDSELSLLSKGLSSYPKPSDIDKFQLKEDINNSQEGSD